MWTFGTPDHAVIIWIAIGVAAVIIIQAIRLATEKNQIATEQLKWNCKDGNASLDAAVNLQPIINEVRAYRDAQARQHLRRYFGDTITFILLIAAAGIAYLQYQTLDNTDQTLKGGQRAWLSFVQDDKAPALTSGLLFQTSATVRVRFEIQNTGHLPAKFMLSSKAYFVGFGGTVPVEERKILLDRVRQVPIENHPFVDVIFPGEKTSQEQVFEFDQSKVEQMIAEKKSAPAFLINCAAYQIIGTLERHMTATIYLLTTNSNDPLKRNISPFEGSIDMKGLRLERHPMGTYAD